MAAVQAVVLWVIWRAASLPVGESVVGGVVVVCGVLCGRRIREREVGWVASRFLDRKCVIRGDLRSQPN
jgi:hypothetical protein